MYHSIFDSLKSSTSDEQEVLLPIKSTHLTDGNTLSRQRGKRAIVAVVAVMALFALAGLERMQSRTTNAPETSLDIVTSSKNLSPFSIKTFNEYGDPLVRRAASGAQDYAFLNGAYLLEPYKNNTVQITAANLSLGVVTWEFSQGESVL
jgi:hypothetical protein